MRRLVLAAAACVFTIVGPWAETSAQEQQGPPAPAKRPLKGYHRRANFEVQNSPTGGFAPHRVSGQGGFPLRLEVVHENGPPRPARLQVFVSISTQAVPNRTKTGERVAVLADPRILETGPGETSRVPFELDVPLPPGDYVAHVFLCDPDTPYVGDLMHHHSFPDPEEFPGMVKKGSAFIVHVEPADCRSMRPTPGG